MPKPTTTSCAEHGPADRSADRLALRSSAGSEIIIFVTDSRGWELTSRAAASAMLAQGTPCAMRIYCHDLVVKAGHPLRDMARKLGWDLSFEAIGDARSERFNERSHVTKTALLKIEALDRAAREYDRVLDLDGDILLFQRFPINAIDFESHAIAAVYDIAECSGLTDPCFQARCKENTVSPHYFNSGVMAVNSQVWRGAGIPERFWQAHAEHLQCCQY